MCIYICVYVCISLAFSRNSWGVTFFVILKVKPLITFGLNFDCLRFGRLEIKTSVCMYTMLCGLVNNKTRAFSGGGLVGGKGGHGDSLKPHRPNHTWLERTSSGRCSTRPFPQISEYTRMSWS